VALDIRPEVFIGLSRMIDAVSLSTDGCLVTSKALEV
jgi:hypothetical protein